MSLSPKFEVYQIRVYLWQISPMIWRRLLVRSDSTIADLHYTLQISMGWTDSHLNRFVIRGQEDEPITEEIACLCRGDLLPETMGLTLTEGKELLARFQEKMVKHQAEEYVGQQR